MVSSRILRSIHSSIAVVRLCHRSHSSRLARDRATTQELRSRTASYRFLGDLRSENLSILRRVLVDSFLRFLMIHSRVCSTPNSRILERKSSLRARAMRTRLRRCSKCPVINSVRHACSLTAGGRSLYTVFASSGCAVRMNSSIASMF